MSDKEKLVANLPLFKDLTFEEIKIITQSVREELKEKGEVFIEQEDQSDAAYFIVSGSVKVFRVTEEGEEITLAVLGQGEVVGELALLDDQRRSASVLALSQTKVYKLTRDDFSKILSIYPRAALSLLKTLAHRVRSINEHLEDVLSKN